MFNQARYNGSRLEFAIPDFERLVLVSRDCKVGNSRNSSVIEGFAPDSKCAARRNSRATPERQGR
jgi:hypothetical protein